VRKPHAYHFCSDLKPNNLLIDQHSHLKLTDFPLSRIGLLGRQTREPMDMGMRHRTRYDSRSRPLSIDSGPLPPPLPPTEMIDGGLFFNQVTHPVPRISPYQLPTDDASESGSESICSHHSRRLTTGLAYTRVVTHPRGSRSLLVRQITLLQTLFLAFVEMLLQWTGLVPHHCLVRFHVAKLSTAQWARLYLNYSTRNRYLEPYG
jgi:hypothetical protein